MKRFVIGFGWLVAACVAVAGTGTSNEFRIDTRTGVRTVAATEKIQYSTAWATNLTAAQQGEAKAVVKVNPCLKTPPKYLVVDMSGGRSAARWPISCLDEVPAGGWTDEYKTEKLVLRYIPAGSFIMGGRATDYPGAAARGIPCFQKEKVAIHFLTATYVKDVLLHCCKAKWQTWRVGTKNHEARKQKTHAGLGENAIPDSQIFNLQTRGILIRRLDASAKEKDDSASSASGGGIWVTAGGRMTVLPGCSAEGARRLSLHRCGWPGRRWTHRACADAFVCTACGDDG